jgi:hypothetical protein
MLGTMEGVIGMAEHANTGRPRKLAADRRTARISIHWKSGEAERIQSAADALGLPLADFLRMAGLEKAREVLDRAAKETWWKS